MISAKAFGIALLQTAQENNAVHEIYEEAHTFLSIIKSFQHKELLSLFSSPAIPKQERVEIVQKLFGKKFHQAFVNFLKVVTTHGQPYLLRIILKYFFDAVENADHLRFITITTAFKLDDDQLKKIVKILESKLKTKIVYKLRLDPHLISGIKIQSDSFLIEQTLQGQLNQILRSLNI